MSDPEPAHPRSGLIALLLGAALAVSLTASTGSGVADLPAKGEDDAMGLLRDAARAARDLSYAGVQSVTSSSVGGTESQLVEVVHRPGEGTGFASASPQAEPDTPSIVVEPSPSLLKLDVELLEELAANYRVTRSGIGVVGGQQATAVEALRADGTAAGRFWIDDETLLPLRREVFDDAGRIAHSSAFLTVETGARTGPLPGSTEQTGPWDDTLSGAELAELRDEGWHAPEQLSWNLRLVEARSTEDTGRPVVHLTYSDGLSTVSVFTQRGRLIEKSPGTIEGLSAVVEDGGTVYVGDQGQHRRVWESAGFVYTLLADAPPELVTPVVAGFPKPEGTGFWARVARGFDRLTRLGGW
ncbi:MAG: hypothetical protein M0026_06925 [Nocardiopsaceae bacterium]|nr:hypothetical protein [Nocardiopsaceae bacterium]